MCIRDRLADVLSPAPGGFFYAAVHGKGLSHVIFQIDPQGVAGLEPEEVSLQNWDWSYSAMLYPCLLYTSSGV